MSRSPDIDRLLEDWFDEASTLPADRVVGAALNEVAHTRQLRGRRSRWSTPAAALIAIAAATILGAVFLFGGRGNVGGPPASPSTSASPTQAATGAAPVQTTTFAVPISYQTPPGLPAGSESKATVDFGSVGIMSIADTQFYDAQGVAHAWPDDLGAWVASQPAFSTTEVTSILVGGRPATQVTVNVDYAPAIPGARQALIQTGSVRWNLIDNPERWRFIQVATGSGRGLLILMISDSSSFEADAATLALLVRSIEFR